MMIKFADVVARVESLRGRMGESTRGVGALLRREGIYASYLTTWRRQRVSSELDGLACSAWG